MFAEMGLPPVKIDPFDDDVFISPQAALHQRCGRMTIRNGSSLSNDPEGLMVSVFHPIENKEFTVRFKAHGQGTNIYKVRSTTNREPDTLYQYVDGTPLYQVAKHVDDWCRAATGGFLQIVVDIDKWCPREQYEQTFKVASCPELVINCNDEDTLMLWVNRIETGLTSLTIKPGVDAVFRRIDSPVHLSEEFTRLPVWSSPSLKELVLMHHIPFTDAQFLNLRIPWFEIICRTLSEETINQYLHKWSSGELIKSKRFGISVDRQINKEAVMKGLLVTQWDEDFCATMTELVESTSERVRKSRFTVFRTVENPEGLAEADKECSNGTLYFDFDGSIYFEVTKKNREFEEKLNQTQRERAKFAP